MPAAYDTQLTVECVTGEPDAIELLLKRCKTVISILNLD